MCECCGGSHHHVHNEMLKVEGMECSHCKNAVEEIKNELSGIDNVEVNLDKGEVLVTHHPDLITLAAIKAFISDKGYKVLN